MSKIFLKETTDENLEFDQNFCKTSKTSEIWMHFDKKQIKLESNHKDLKILGGNS